MDNYLFITADGHPLPVADRLSDEGKNVVVGLVENPPEDHDANHLELRSQLYDGILEIQPAEEVMRWAKGVRDKDDWFVMLDYGDLFPWSERLLEMGFRNGIFPTEEGWTLESDRGYGKEFARQHYPGLEVAEAPEFKKVEEGIDFLHENPDKIFVLKSDGSEAETVVPMTLDAELAQRQVIGALNSEREGYEKGGFSLEEKIKKPIEITPIMVFWNGKPLFSLVEIENKGFGAGNIGRLTGGCQNITIETPMDCRLNRIAFPEIVYEMAERQPGIGLYDAGMLFDGKKFFFTEFCGHRWGWDGIFSELSMCREKVGLPFVSRHFDLIAEGKSPIANKYGCAIRLFQTQPHPKMPGLFKDGYTMDWDDEAADNLFFYCLKRQEGESEGKEVFTSVGYRRDLGVAVGTSNYMEAAVDEAYAALDRFVMTGAYYRPKFDFFSRDYPTSIARRYQWLVNSGYID